MAVSFLTSNKLNNLDNEILHCINQHKVYKKGSNIDSKYHFLESFLSNEQKIKFKLFNNSASYSVNEEPANCENYAVFSSAVFIHSSS